MGGGLDFFSSHNPRAKIFFSGQSKNIFFFFFFFFFLISIYTRNVSFRFIRSCISWTQYTWVYCLYIRIYMYLGYLGPSVYEPRHDKTNKMAVRPAKTQISLDIRPVWSESSLSAWRSIGSLSTHWAQAKTLIRLGGCPDWSESSLGAHSFCWFCHVVAHMYCWCASFYIEWYPQFFWYKLQGKYVNERYSLGARNIYFP